MLPAERRKLIADLVRRHSSVQINDLCARLGASSSTVRRDLAYLEREGVLKRTYGGAVAVDTVGEQKVGLSSAKLKIGAATAGLVDDGETIFLGPGTTTLAVAHHLVAKAGVTVITNALDIASFLTANSALPVILTGGQVDRHETATLGHIAELALRELRADRAVIGVGGIHVPDGFTGDSLAAVRLMRMVIELMPEVVVVADHSKWGRVGPAFLAPLEAIDVIVTDLQAPAAMVWDLCELGIKVIQT